MSARLSDADMGGESTGGGRFRPRGVRLSRRENSLPSGGRTYRPRTAVALVFTLGACQETPSAPEGGVATDASPSVTARHRADADLFVDAVPLQPGVTADPVTGVLDRLSGHEVFP